jgi:uncharacterized protein (TIGR01244 family)
MNDIYKLLRIDATLSTSGQPTEAQLAAVAAEGFEQVINLALHDDPRYSLPDEAGTVRSLGMDYVHIPVQFKAPTLDDLTRFFDAMDAAKGRKLLVHCAANIRVTSFLGLYRVLRLGWDHDTAFEPMHTIWQPDEVWAAFIAQALGTTIDSPAERRAAPKPAGVPSGDRPA